MEMTTLTLEVPSNQLDVHQTVHKAIMDTMAAGQASNGVDTWRHKDPVKYHLRKGMLHVLALHHAGELDSVETDPPHLPHIKNAITRLALALTTWKNRDFQAVEVSND